MSLSWLKIPRIPLRWRIAAVVVAIAAPLAWYGFTRVDEGKAIASARAHLEAHEPQPATVYLKSLLAVQPNHALARRLLGESLLAQREAAAAEAELRRAMQLGVPQSQVAPLLANALLDQGKPDAVLSEFGRMEIAEAQPAADLLVQIARAHLAKGDEAGAKRALDDALSRKSGHADALLMVARSRWQAGKVAEARSTIEAVLKERPDNARAWVYMGDLQAGQGDPAAAAESYKKAVKLQPLDLSAYTAMVMLDLKRKDLAGAREMQLAMQKAAPRSVTTFYVKAMLEYLSGNYAAAREALQQLLKAGSVPPQIDLLAGMTELRLGARAQAETHLNKAMTGMPASTEPRKVLAQLMIESGRAKRALELLDPATPGAATDPEFWSLIGQSQASLGEFDKADAAFVKARKINPDDPTVMTEMGRSMAARGKVDAAVTLLSSAAANANSGTRADIALISALMLKRDLAGALKAVDGLAKKQPDSAMVDVLRGQVLEATRDLDGARRAYMTATSKDGRYEPALTRLAALDVTQGRFDEAQQRYDKVMEADPKATWAMLAAADMARRAGRGRQAVGALLDQAVKVNPTDAGPWVSAVQVHLDGGDTVGAVSRARAAVAALPNEPAVLDRLVQTLMLTGEDNRQALSTVNDLITLRPRDLAPRLRAIDVHLALKNVKAASAQWNEALNLDPNSAEVAAAGMRIALFERAYKRALDLARARQKAQPKQALGWVFEAQTMVAQDNRAGAIAALRTALTKEGGAEHAARLHFQLAAGGQQEVADQFAQQWLKDHPDDVNFITHLALLAAKANDHATAEKRYRQALALRPQSALLLNELALVLLKTGKPEALTLARNAVAMSPDHPAMLDTLAHALAAGKQWSEALEVQTKAVELDPKDSVLRLELAKMYMDTGDRKKARIELERLAELSEALPAVKEAQRMLRLL